MSGSHCSVGTGAVLHPVHRRYLLLSSGRVYRKRRGGGSGVPWWEELVPFLDRYGYPSVHVQVDGQNRLIGVHTLVLEAFVGFRPDGMECRHLDGSNLNNRLDNLCWGTKAENEADKERHGRIRRGSQQSQAKLTEADVLDIRRRAQSEPQIRLAEEYGISNCLVSHIVNRKAWAHVT